jgi:hypothetical protein
MTRRSGSVGRIRPGQEMKISISLVSTKHRSIDQKSSKDNKSYNDYRGIKFTFVTILSTIYIMSWVIFVRSVVFKAKPEDFKKDILEAFLLLLPFIGFVAIINSCAMYIYICFLVFYVYFYFYLQF